MTLRAQLEKYERQLLLAALWRHQGHRQRTARELGISRENLWKKLKKYGLHPDEGRPVRRRPGGAAGAH